MMKVHEIKSWPESFQPTRQRVKLAEFRRDDRGYEVGDLLVIREYDPNVKMRYTEPVDADCYTGEVEFARITHKTEGGSDGHGIPEGYCVLSIWPMALISGGGPSAASLEPAPTPPPGKPSTPLRRP